MKTLCLLRHAKSDWASTDPSGAELPDHDRPLAPRGERAAATMADYLRRRKAGPPALDLVLCSTARRARDTLDRVVQAWDSPPQVRHEQGLYLCGEAALLQRLRALPEGVGRVMLVGHNPDFHELACALGVQGDPPLLQAMRQKLPTGTFVEIELPDAPWAGLQRGTGRLVSFVPPRSLAEHAGHGGA